MERFQDLSDPKTTEAIVDVLSELNHHVRNESSKYADFSGMGATVVLAMIRKTHALFTHMGDSRAYLLREKHLERLTNDHSIVQILIDNGEISPEEAATHPARSENYSVYRDERGKLYQKPES